jgi:SAM-dependent methyltransferase
MTGRSYLEYEAFFALGPADLSGKVLDCASGASGFAAEANRRGARVTAVDPAYAAPRERLIAQAHGSLARGDALVDAHADRFTWVWFGSAERRAALRRDALAAFSADLERSPGTYVAGALPELPFADDEFDLALCSHLLFTWSDLLDEEWHARALTELLRVARQVRIFPLVNQGTGRPVPFLPHLLGRLGHEGHGVEIVSVPYVFQVDAAEMLRVTRRPAS